MKELNNYLLKRKCWIPVLSGVGATITTIMLSGGFTEVGFMEMLLITAFLIGFYGLICRKRLNSISEE